jgi:hypothetical protein
VGIDDDVLTFHFQCPSWHLDKLGPLVHIAQDCMERASCAISWQPHFACINPSSRHIRSFPHGRCCCPSHYRSSTSCTRLCLDFCYGPWSHCELSTRWGCILYLAVVCDNATNEPRACLPLATFPEPSAHWHDLVGFTYEVLISVGLTRPQKHILCWNRAVHMHSSDSTTLCYSQRCVGALSLSEAFKFRSNDPGRVCCRWSSHGQTSDSTYLDHTDRGNHGDYRRCPSITNKHIARD